MYIFTGRPYDGYYLSYKKCTKNNNLLINKLLF